MDKERQIRLLYPALVLLLFWGWAYDSEVTEYVRKTFSTGTTGSVPLGFIIFTGLVVLVLVLGFLLGSVSTCLLQLIWARSNRPHEARFSRTATVRIATALGIFEPKRRKSILNGQIEKLEHLLGDNEVMDRKLSSKVIELEKAKTLLELENSQKAEELFGDLREKDFILCAAATLDHELLSKGVHTWMMRRWHSFRVASTSVIALTSLLLWVLCSGHTVQDIGILLLLLLLCSCLGPL